MKQDYIMPSKETWYSNKYGDFYLPKEIVKKLIDVNNPATFIPLLEWGDWPYIKWQWEDLVKRYGDYTVFGRYLSKMKLNHWKYYTFKDSDFLNETYDKLLNLNKGE